MSESGDQLFEDLQKKELGHEFLELDEEISRHEKAIFQPTISSSTKPLLARILMSIRNTLLPMTNITTYGRENPKPNIGSTNQVGVMLTCRICENLVDEDTLEGHTDWCAKYQDCLLKKEKCAQFLSSIIDSLYHIEAEAESESGIGTRTEVGSKINFDLMNCAERALEIDEETGAKSGSIRLAKLLYKLAKIDSNILKSSDGLALKRLRYVVEQKKMLADRFSELNPKSRQYQEFSSYTDSSLDSTPGRIDTPVSKLTTMLSELLLRRPRSASKSPLFGSSPPRSSQLRASTGMAIPKIGDFDILKPISKGAYGNVFLARKKKTMDLFAIKALKKSEMASKNMTSHVLTERKMLSLAQAPFIVMLYYAFESREYLFLVMEYLIGGDLSSLVQEKGPLPEELVKFYITQIIQAVEYLHENGIIHRDIKPDNILLDADGHVKLTDFGLASLSNQNIGDRLLGTPGYIAPEIIRGQEHGTAVDWWSVGVCMFELLFGIIPFNGDTPTEVLEAVLGFEKIDWGLFDDDDDGIKISNEAKDLINRLIDPNPSTRLGSVTIKAHPFFLDLQDWTNIRSTIAPLIPKPIDPLDTSNFDARNQRYKDVEMPESFADAEPLAAPDETISSSGFSTPNRFSLNRRASSSPFDGFSFKNIDLLSKVNRRLSSTPTPCMAPGSESGASSAGLSSVSSSIP